MGLPDIRNKNTGYIAKFWINDKSLFFLCKYVPCNVENTGGYGCEFDLEVYWAHAFRT